MEAVGNGGFFMRIGATIPLDRGIDGRFRELTEMGMDSCQLVSWDGADQTDEMAALVSRAAEARGVRVSAFWCGWPGPKTWDFYEGQRTLGLVPALYREVRVRALTRGSDFAKKLNVRDLVTHVGYIPENPYAPEYPEVVAAVRAVAEKCAENSQRFLFETGQETPVALLRMIEDIGLDNVGVNLDPANLLMYGKANPCDALKVIGKYVMGVHCKDGLYPTDGRQLGREVPMGEGVVDFPRLIASLEALGYRGDYTIEREISGEQQRRDILKAVEMLGKLIPQT
jgi:sugar phosphate isomerase/epimerase